MDNAAAAMAAIDVETQCAVEMANRKRCQGSLRCKRHGMAKKRAVPGRIMPFDQLLALSPVVET